MQSIRGELRVLPTDGLSWPDARHSRDHARYLTEADARAPNPAGFRGTLYPPQKTILAAMLDLEARHVLDVGGCPTETRAGRIAEAPSFGKTVLALALVAARPRVGPAAYEAAPLGSWVPGDRVPEASILPTGECRGLGTTVVAAAANIITQWIANTRRFTDLRYEVVDNAISLTHFAARRGPLPDLLFVKAGRAVSKTDKSRSIIAAVAGILGAPVARLIVDDYDTLRLGQDDQYIEARFTWLVSATRRKFAGEPVTPPVTTLAEFFVARTPLGRPILGATLDPLINTAFSLRCDPAYVAAHLNSTLVRFRRVRVRSGRSTQALRALGVDPAVADMVGAGAVETAAATLGSEVAARSAGDLVRLVISRRTQASHTPAEGRSGTTAATQLARLRDNIREGCCQCCTLEIEGPAFVLAGCCQIVVCEPCVRGVISDRCPHCAAPLAGLVKVDPSDLRATSANPEAGPKLRALIALLRGEAPECASDEIVPPFVEGLLEGRRDVPAEGPGRALIYTSYAEASRLIAATLEAAGIRTRIYQGWRSEKDAAVSAVRRGESEVLIISTAKDCAGLDLPFLTHIIYFQRAGDQEIEAQVAGRGQRLGRTCNLEIVLLEDGY